MIATVSGTLYPDFTFIHGTVLIVFIIALTPCAFLELEVIALVISILHMENTVAAYKRIASWTGVD